MNTKELTREQISAFSDGELSDKQAELALGALHHDDAKADWDIYHRIGDVLRSDDMAFELSPGFAARMAARLDAEPAILAPGLGAAGCERGDSPGRTALPSSPKASAAKRWAVPGFAAAAAMAAVAFVATPQLMVAFNGNVAESVPQNVALTAQPAAVKVATAPVAATGTLVTASAPEGEVLRDARIDDYLLAHQRFSPSVYSTAQYARSATFPTESNK